METGDLCADTAPTPKSKACHDPGDVSDTCGVTTYQDTPYSNYMSYTGTVNKQSIPSLLVISSRPTVRHLEKNDNITSITWIYIYIFTKGQMW